MKKNVMMMLAFTACILYITVSCATVRLDLQLDEFLYLKVSASGEDWDLTPEQEQAFARELNRLTFRYAIPFLQVEPAGNSYDRYQYEIRCHRYNQEKTMLSEYSAWVWITGIRRGADRSIVLELRDTMRYPMWAEPTDRLVELLEQFEK